MRVKVTTTEARSILTRSSGYLNTVSSHSLQPYMGCSFGQSLCGVGCYVQHNRFVTGGAPWGSLVVAKTNAAELYRSHHACERRWAQRRGVPFSIFMSSATDPFLPHETRLGISRQVLETMLDVPPDELIVQTHTAAVLDHLRVIKDLSMRCKLRVHISIETDCEQLQGLPPPPSKVEQRLQAARILRDHGVYTVITVAPLLPIAAPVRFFQRIAEVADAVVLDHFIGGDGSRNGTRTRRTGLPARMETIQPGSTSLDYLQQMVGIARRVMPGRVGTGIDGFAGRLLK